MPHTPSDITKNYYVEIAQIVIDMDQTAPLTYLNRLKTACPSQFGIASAPE